MELDVSLVETGLVVLKNFKCHHCIFTTLKISKLGKDSAFEQT